MRALALIAALLAAACVRPGDDRARLDDDVGLAEVPPISVVAVDGQAHIRSLTASQLILWSQAPSIDVSITNDGDVEIEELTVVLENTAPGAELSVRGENGPLQGIEVTDTGRRTARRVSFGLQARQRVRLTLDDPIGAGPVRVAVMGDIQEAMSTVDEVFALINDADVEFVVSTGDIVDAAKDEEYDLWEEQLRTLEVPFYSTIGNHELRRDIEQWHRRYGRYNIHFEHRGVVFTFVDSGNASIDPIVTGRLEDWLEVGADTLHLVGTHYPPFDPIGGRQASFRSRKEASAFLARLARGGVDMTFYGHIHSYYAYDNAGIPAFISGGGGALPEQLDNIGRHFLIVDANAATNQLEVALIRVD